MPEKRTFLYVNTITAHAVLTIVSGGKHFSVPFGEMRSYSKDLLANFDRVLKKARVKADSLNAVIVLTGPGSYTSIRIGVSFANAVGFALNIPVVGKTLFEVLSYEAKKNLPMLVEAGRGNIFVALGQSETVLAREELTKKKWKEVYGFELTTETKKALKGMKIHSIGISTDGSWAGVEKVIPKTTKATPHYVIPPHISKRKKKNFF